MLNQLRREALEQLLKQRGQAPVIPFHPVSFPANTLRQSTEPLPLRAVFTRLHSADDIPDCANVCQMIYIPINTKEHIVKELQNRGLPLAVTMPRRYVRNRTYHCFQTGTVPKMGYFPRLGRYCKQRCTGKDNRLQSIMEDILST